jgi:flagellar M-ring protein FliF
VDKIGKFAGPLAAAWAKLNGVQKATATMMGVLALVGLAVALSLATRPQYSVLFSNLSANDASAIVDKLKEQKVEYRVAAGGTAVEVPTDNVYDLRLQMAGAGLPQGGTVGFEIFDKSSFGMTEFTQKLNYQRALQGELAKTIGELSPVADARVHLVIPEQSLYSDKEAESTASVVVKLRPGGQLGPEQVAAITNLVSAAVQGLKPTGVAVIDTAGNLLSDASDGPLSGNGLRLSSSQMQMQKQYEGQMARDLQAMLDKVVGAGKAVVRVSARMNFDSTQTDKETYLPSQGNQGVLVSQDNMQETYGGGAKPAGAPAVPAAANAAGAANGTYNRTQTNSKFEVTKQIQHIIQAPGKVERLSVAVLLDGQVNPATGNTIRQTISTAVGLDPVRGDKVTVDSLPFDNTAAQAQDKEMLQQAKREMTMNYAKWGAAVLLGLIFLVFLRSFLTNWRPIEITESYPQPLPIGHAEALEMRSDEPAEPALRRIAPRKITELATENAEETAKVVRSWLAES